jgi:hypothetical protein
MVGRLTEPPHLWVLLLEPKAAWARDEIRRVSRPRNLGFTGAGESKKHPSVRGMDSREFDV